MAYIAAPPITLMQHWRSHRGIQPLLKQVIYRRPDARVVLGSR